LYLSIVAITKGRLIIVLLRTLVKTMLESGKVKSKKLGMTGLFSAWTTKEKKTE